MRYIINADPRLQIENPYEITAAPEIVFIAGEITDETALLFRREMELAEHNALAAGQEILPIVIDTPGGCIYSLMGMIDAIDACSVKIATVAEAKVMSAGVVLITCGDPQHRYMGPSATLMVHSASGGTLGTLEEVQNEAKELKRLYDEAFKRMAKNCGKTKSFFINKVKKHGPEWYINSKEAKRLGIISHIGIPVLTTDITFSHRLALK